MPDWKNALIPADATIRMAIETIQNCGYQIALVCDETGRFLGTVTDGDVRRGLLSGYGMDGSALEIANRNPRTVPVETPRTELVATLNTHLLRQLPLMAPDGSVAGIAHIDELQHGKVQPQNPVVLMAGGLGKRLRPLTENTPKPLLSVGDKPLLETILESFVEQGFRTFYISVNYLAETIVEHFGDGERWGIDVHYLREEEPLGTAGALRLLPERPDLPLIVMNADLITRVNFSDLLEYHEDACANGTMCVREYDMEVPFGVVDIEDNRIRAIDEKPVHRFFVNAGIYVVSPQTLDLLPRDGAYDMTGLFDAMTARGDRAVAFPIHEYWLDVGRIDDFEQAKIDVRNGDLR